MTCGRIQRTVCTCDTPGQGTAGYNKFTCTNGATRYCSHDEECYATGKFTYGKWEDGCRRPVCTCDTPGQGTAGHNKFTCTNGATRSCSHDEACYATGKFTYGKW